MARRGRRLTIGGSGLLSDDDLLAQTGERGEVRRFAPISEEEARRQAASIGRVSEESASSESAPTPVIISVPGPGGSGTGAGEGNPGDPGGEGGPGGVGAPASGEGPSDASGVGPDSSGPFAKGGRVGGPAGEHPITAQGGEFVMRKEAVQRYGMSVMEALNNGTAQIQRSTKTGGEAYRYGGLVSAPEKRKMRRLA